MAVRVLTDASERKTLSAETLRVFLAISAFRTLPTTNDRPVILRIQPRRTRRAQANLCAEVVGSKEILRFV